MRDWLRGITTEAWNPAEPPPSLAQPDSPAVADLGAALPFRPSPRSDDQPERNVFTLRNGQRLDSPERFFDWLECYHRHHVDPGEPGALDRLLDCRRTVELRANQRRRRSHN